MIIFSKLLKKKLFIFQRTIENIEPAFILPVQHYAPGQENKPPEERERITIDVAMCDIKKLRVPFMEDMVEFMRDYVTNKLDELDVKDNTDFTPDSEFKYWKDKLANYSRMMEQLNYPFVQKILGKNP